MFCLPQNRPPVPINLLPPPSSKVLARRVSENTLLMSSSDVLNRCIENTGAVPVYAAWIGGDVGVVGPAKPSGAEPAGNAPMKRPLLLALRRRSVN